MVPRTHGSTGHSANTSFLHGTRSGPRWLVAFARGGPPGSVIIPGELPWWQDLVSWEWPMTLGLAPRQADLFRSTAAFCEGRVAPDSIYGILHREGFRLFPDEMFADLFDEARRPSVPPVIVAGGVGVPRGGGWSDRGAGGPVALAARGEEAGRGL